MVTVKLFGTLRLDSGLRELRLEANSVHALYPALLREIEKRRPDAGITEKHLRTCLVTVNGKQARPGTKLRDEDLVYLLPPAAGG